MIRLNPVAVDNGGKITHLFAFAEALRAIEADDVTLEMRDSLKLGSLRAVGDDDFLYVFMPMRMR